MVNTDFWTALQDIFELLFHREVQQSKYLFYVLINNFLFIFFKYCEYFSAADASG